VVSFISGLDAATELNAEVFVLEPESSPDLGDDREALGRQADQAQRQSRALRREQPARREGQAALGRRSQAARSERNKRSGGG
jgi:hypothetical protein